MTRHWFVRVSGVGNGELYGNIGPFDSEIEATWFADAHREADRVVTSVHELVSGEDLGKLWDFLRATGRAS